MKHQIMTVMLDALIINALPPKFLQKRFPLLFPWCICSIVYMSRRPWAGVTTAIRLQLDCSTTIRRHSLYDRGHCAINRYVDTSARRRLACQRRRFVMLNDLSRTAVESKSNRSCYQRIGDFTALH